MKKREEFSSRLGLILAAVGMAVGAGNIWRFPRMVAQNGGSAFLIPWIIFLFLWSIPLLMVEFTMGKTARMGTIGAFGKFMGKKYAWMGAFVGFCTMGIMFYYSVVTGWSLHYFVKASLGQLNQVVPGAYWNHFTTSPLPLFDHLIAISVASWIVLQGVTGGIERANKLLIPSLFILVVIASIRAVTLPGAVEGLNYLFNPDFSKLIDFRVWLEALSQSAWSTGAGWGLILTYGVYLKKNEDVVLNSFVTGLGNNSASLFAALAIIPTVFALFPLATALNAMKSGNTGLTFIYIPKLFEKMPAGNFFAALFFLALTFAALSSLISMVELATRLFMDMGLNRKKAIRIVWVVTLFLGAPSALSLKFFNNQDWTWGIGLLVSGFFLSLAVIKFGVSHFREDLLNSRDSDIRVGKWFEYIVRFVIPLEFAAMLIWWFYQSITTYDPSGWWNPFHTYSLGTCLLQWGVVLVFFIGFNKWLVRWTLEREGV